MWDTSPLQHQCPPHPMRHLALGPSWAWRVPGAAVLHARWQVAGEAPGLGEPAWPLCGGPGISSMRDRNTAPSNPGAHLVGSVPEPMPIPRLAAKALCPGPENEQSSAQTLAHCLCSLRLCPAPAGVLHWRRLPRANCSHGCSSRAADTAALSRTTCGTELLAHQSRLCASAGPLVHLCPGIR